MSGLHKLAWDLGLEEPWVPPPTFVITEVAVFQTIPSSFSFYVLLYLHPWREAFASSSPREEDCIALRDGHACLTGSL